MSGFVSIVAIGGQVAAGETYLDLLRSGPHWLFEMTLEVLTTPLAFLVGRAWRRGLLNHLHDDLDTLAHRQPRNAHHCATAPAANAAPERARPCPSRPTTLVAVFTARSAQRAPTARRVPFSWFSIPFGLAGLAGSWSYGADLGLAARPVSVALTAISATVWVVLLIAYLRGARRLATVAADVRDATTGPFAALVLLTPVLILVQARGVAPTVAKTVFDVIAILIVALAGHLIGQWTSTPLVLDQLHPGYFLPSVAGGYVGALAASTFGQHNLAWLLFGLASMSWVVLGAVVTGRLLLGPPLPAALVPTLAVQIAPPALATLAWLSLRGGRLDAVVYGLAGYGLLMIAAQLPLLAAYRQLPFTLSAWAFTFPVVAVGTAGMHWLALTHPVGPAVWQALLLIAVTLLVAGIGVRSLIAWRRGELAGTVGRGRTGRRSPRVDEVDRPPRREFASAGNVNVADM